MRTHHFFFAVFLSCFLVFGQAHAGWVPVATVNEKTPGHLCDVDDNGLDLFCGGNNPQLMANGGISSTSISTTVINFEGVTATSVLGAGGNFIVSGTTSVSASNAGTIKFATAGSERVVIDGNGRVGIGEISPTVELEVPGTISATGISTTSLHINSFPVPGLAPVKGRIIVGNGTSWTNVGLGTDGQVLTADSSQPSGIRWTDMSGGGSIVDSSYGTSGYVRFSDGLLLQWGVETGIGVQTITFPTAFPTAFIAAWGGPNVNITNDAVVAPTFFNGTTTSMKGRNKFENGDAGEDYWWFAIGY